MSDQVREERLDDYEITTPGDSTYTVNLGLVAAPEVPEKVARELASELPGLLGRKAPEILDVCRDRRLEEGWDLAVCLTDLPVYRSGRLVEELYTRIPELGRDTAPDETDESGAGADAAEADSTEVRSERPRQSVVRRPTEIVAPFRRVGPPDEDMKGMDVDARFAAPGVPGRLRLLSGMVLANRPWKLFPSFKGTLATGAYVLVITAMSMLSDAVGFWRLLLLMVTAKVAMVVWIIVAHHLW
ncbi:MAG TPA: hypothetical protein VFI90_04000 [Rubrobacter sp.]|nr:hypothetical protein [Rubrobacter sp.]